MRIGIGAWPDGTTPRAGSVHYVYDTRNGRVVATHRSFGEPLEGDEPEAIDLQRQAHQASGVALAHLAVLQIRADEEPLDEGIIRVDLNAGTLNLTRVDTASRNLT